MSQQKIRDYEIHSVLGQGAMGVVYKAYDPFLDRFAAVKVMTSGELDDQLRARFFREGRSAAKLNHPNIVIIYQMDEDRSRPFIAMEYVEGEDLKTLIKKRTLIPFRQKLDLIIQVCHGLHYAHINGVVHRDIKPGNIRVTPDGKARILDFGLARLGSSEMTRTGVLMGTPYYMSPEQVKGVRDLDGRTDLFSLGVILYELISYQRPFEADTPTSVCYKIVSEPHAPLSEILFHCPPDLVQIIDCALSKERERRFANCQEFAEALERFKLRLPGEGEALRPYLETLGSQLEKHRCELTKLEVSGLFDAGLFGVPALEGDPGDYGNLLLHGQELQQRLKLIVERRDKARLVLDLLRRARQELEESGWDASLKTVRQILQIHPENTDAGRLQQECLNRLEEQHREQQRSLRLNAALEVARSAMARGKLEQCLNAASSALRVAPDHGEALELRRAALESMERRQRFETLLERALHHYHGQQYEAGVNAATEALQLEPENSELKALYQSLKSALERERKIDSLLILGRKHIEQQQYGLARKVLDELSGLAPDHPEVSALEHSVAQGLELQEKVDRLLALARSCEAEQQWEACLQATAEALQLQPQRLELRQLDQRIRAALDKRDKVNYLVATAKEHLLRREYAATLKHVDDLLAIEPDHEAALEIRDAASEGTKRQQEIDKLLRTAYRYFKARDYEACVKASNEVLRIDPEHPEGKQLLQLVQQASDTEQQVKVLLEEVQKHLEKEDLRTALTLLDNLLALEPRHSQAWKLRRAVSEKVEKTERLEELLTAARRWFQAGEYESCRGAAAEALRLEPDHPELKMLYERAQQESDEQRKIKSLLAKAERQVAKEELRAASKTLAELLILEPEHAQALELKCSVSERAERVQRVKQQLVLARRLEKTEKYEACYKTASEALQLDPSHPELKELLQRTRPFSEQEAPQPEPEKLTRYPETPSGRDPSLASEDTALLEANLIMAPTQTQETTPSSAPAIAIRDQVPLIGQGYSLEAERDTSSVEVMQDETARLDISTQKGFRHFTWSTATSPLKMVSAPWSLAALVIVGVAVLMASFFYGGRSSKGVISTNSGTLVLNVAPWARVDSITRVPDQKAVPIEDLVTPCVITLPPGTYHLKVSNSDLNQRLEFQVKVAPGQPQSQNYTLPGFTPEMALK